MLVVATTTRLLLLNRDPSRDELRGRGVAVDLAAIEADLARRDALDQHVMAPAPDALVLSNETLRPSEEVDLILARLAEQ